MKNDGSKLKLDLPLLLPEVPDERDRGVQTLIGLLRGRDGVLEAHVVAAHGADPAQLCIHFDRNRLSLAKVRRTREPPGLTRRSCRNAAAYSKQKCRPRAPCALSSTVTKLISTR